MMKVVVSEYEQRASKIPLVQFPGTGMMLFQQQNSGYRTQDLSFLSEATRQSLLKASSSVGLSGMSAYIKAFFPRNSLGENGIVSQERGRDFMEVIRSFVAKIERTAEHLTAEFSFRSSPTPAILSLTTGGGTPLPRMASPTLVSNVYRGFYSYEVQQFGYKRIQEQLNLIDQDIQELNCYLVLESDPRTAYPCYTRK